jgi:hypothetical protein
MQEASKDPSGFVIPMADSTRCSVSNGRLWYCDAVNVDVPLPDIIVEAVPVVTYVRLEAMPFDTCQFSDGHVRPLPLRFHLTADGIEESSTLALKQDANTRAPVLLSANARLPASKWATSVNVKTDLYQWKGQLDSRCRVSLRVWPNYPHLDQVAAKELLASLQQNIDDKDRMLDYAQFIVDAAPSVEILQTAMATLLDQLATSTNKELQEHKDELIEALDTTLDVFAFLPDASIDHATEDAILSLCDILENIPSEDHSFNNDGQPFTIRQVLGDDDADRIETSVHRAAELTKDATRDIERLAIELPETRKAYELASSLLHTTIFETAGSPTWDGQFVATGKITVVGTSLFPTVHINHTWGATTLADSDVTDELARLQGGIVRVHGLISGNKMVPAATYHVLDLGTGLSPDVVGVVAMANGGLVVTTTDGNVVRLDFRTEHRQKRFINRGYLSAKMWFRGVWDGQDRLSPTRYGVLRPAE